MLNIFNLRNTCEGRLPTTPLTESAPQLENTPWWGKHILRKGENDSLGEQTYTKYNKINNNSENFRGARLLLLAPP